MRRRDNWKRYARVMWSGGIDSTAVVGHLLKRGFIVQPHCLRISKQGLQAMRETVAINKLTEHFKARCLSGEWMGVMHDPIITDGHWLWNFSPDGIEIPRRNKHIIDHMITAYMINEGTVNLGLGEYSGVDTWLVQDHVQGADCDTRALSGYVWQEWGPDFKLWTLDDFGVARYKSDRVRLLLEVLPEAHAVETTCCLLDEADHCGNCYKCVERHAAFMTVQGHDLTEYQADPRRKAAEDNLGGTLFERYMDQMYGRDLKVTEFEGVR